MRKMQLFFLLLVAALLTACTAPSAFIGNPAEISAANEATYGAPTVPITFDILLQDALRLLSEGMYEEAILAFTQAIEIEPKSFDAQFGLGQSYRKNKQSDKAIEPLNAALNLRVESKSTAIELGYAYLDIGEYVETEKLVRGLLGDRMPDLDTLMPTPQTEGGEVMTSAPIMPLSDEEGEALTLLLLGFGGQEKMEELQALLQYEALREYLDETVMDDDVLYVGAYNEDGQRDGKGVGIYPSGYVYVGDYQSGIRSGQGKWCRDSWFYIGEWMDDAPNGEGEYQKVCHPPAVREDGHTYAVFIYEKANYIYGVVNGPIYVKWTMDSGNCGTHEWQFNVDDGATGSETVANCIHCDADLLGSDGICIYGILPWLRSNNNEDS